MHTMIISKSCEHKKSDTKVYMGWFPSQQVLEYATRNFGDRNKISEENTFDLGQGKWKSLTDRLKNYFKEPIPIIFSK